jgi:lipopolysaccharide/colanic/teichoic acid biosynthesis glycosyltransferase
MGLILALPILLGTWALIASTLGSPVFFTQIRPGRRGRAFRLVKFRTMRDSCDASGRPLPDADRMTGVGRFLRATSVDELPQLWNVLRGELSLVGPRPLLMEYLDRYTPEQKRRHEVYPGITGWAQVHGRNALSWEEKFALDIWYVDHWSLALDLKIVGMTVIQLLRPRGISQGGYATMPEFTGVQTAGKARAVDSPEAAAKHDLN